MTKVSNWEFLPRGLGSIKEENGVKIVGEDFMLATAADIVADPSAPDAFVNGIMEGKEWVWANGNVHESKIDEIKKRVDNAAVAQLERERSPRFHSFLKNL